MTVNARDEVDVDPETILNKVAKASGANFNFHQKNQGYKDMLPGPVVSRHLNLKPYRTFWGLCLRFVLLGFT